MGKVILFLRVSTQKQGLESQELVVRRMANADGFSDENILPPIQYKENATKLDEKNREGIQELYSTIESRNDVEAIYVSELSRLSRKPNVLYAIRDYLIERKIQLVCGSPSFKLLDINKNLDKMASLVFAIFGAFAEQEAIEKKERFARGKEQRALEGKFTGGNIPYGYKVLPNKTIVIDEYLDEEGNVCGTAQIVRLVFNLYEEGFSQPKMAKELASRGIRLNIDLINHILKNESYVGELSKLKKYKAKDRITNEIKEYNKYPRQYPQIITREQFERCRKIANDNNIGLGCGKTKNIYFAENLMRCTSCGSKITASGSKDTYHCYSAYKPISIWEYEYHRMEKCTDTKSISVNVLDSLLWAVSIELEAEFMMHASDEKVQKTQLQIDMLMKKIDVVDSNLNKIENKKKKIVRLYIDEELTDEEYSKLKQDIEREKWEYENEKQTYLEKRSHYEEIINTISSKYIEKREEIKKARLEGNSLLPELMLNYWNLQNAEIEKIYSSIYNVKDDKTRYEIIHRQIESVSFEKVELYFRYGIGWRKVKANRITIIPINEPIPIDEEYHENKMRFLHIPCGGSNSIYLNEDSDNEYIFSSENDLDDVFRYVRYEEDGYTYTYSVVPVEFLKRYEDKGKRARREKAKADSYKCVEGYLRIEDVMEMGNLKYYQVYHAIHKGKLKSVLVNKKCFITPTDAEEYIKSLNQKEG